MGKKRGAKRKGKRKTGADVRKEEEKEDQQKQNDLSEDPCKTLSLEEQMEVELELKLLEALEIYPPAKLRGIHRHFVLYGLTEYLQRSFNKSFTGDEVLKLLDRFYNLEMLEPDDDEADILKKEKEFCLPPSFFCRE